MKRRSSLHTDRLGTLSAHRMKGCNRDVRRHQGDSAMRFARPFALAALLATWAATLAAQGVQTGTIRGVVHDEQGLAVPGVTVSVASPALQTPRANVTDASGAYVFPNLPPGEYTVTFELSGF